MQDKELSQEESLQLIQSMLDIAKNKISNSGFHFILWGTLIIIVSLSQYAIRQLEIADDASWTWVILPLAGVPIAIFYELRRGRKGVARSKFDKIYGALWLGFGITLLATIFISLSSQVNPIAFVLALVGLATFVSGIIYRFKPLIVGALFFWIAATVCPLLNEIDQLLLNAVAIFAGYIIPGILLWKKSKASV